MRFEDFARLHGLIINSVTPNRWMAVPTEDKPRSTNGRYKYLGDVGWVQNWATMEKPITWKPDGDHQVDHTLRASIQKDIEDRKRNAEKAIAKAGWILKQSALDNHPYLVAKGFDKERGFVWDDSGVKKLVIPMRVGEILKGCQLISPDGNKKFLFGQQTKGASFRIGTKGIKIFCEGYATALSIKSAMMANKIQSNIFACFSASNLKEIATQYPDGMVVADNDPNQVGEQTAKATGKVYWLSDKVGEDFNDYFQRVGLFQASQSLKRIVSSCL